MTKLHDLTEFAELMDLMLARRVLSSGNFFAVKINWNFEVEPSESYGTRGNLAGCLGLELLFSLITMGHYSVFIYS